MFCVSVKCVCVFPGLAFDWIYKVILHCNGANAWGGLLTGLK